MAILKVARLGHPVLRRVATPVDPSEIAGPEIQGLIEDMIETCREYDGAGLAAPQVHVPVRVVLMELDENPRYPGTPRVPLTVVINPEITVDDAETQKVWEGCLSVPELRGLVPRHRAIRLRGLDREGAAFERRFEGFPAAVVQHECDHLDGKVFLDRMETMDSLHFLPEFRRYKLPELSGPVED